MPEFMFRTACNNPRLRDPTMVVQIIARYYFDFDLAVCVQHENGQCHLNIEGDGWPAAWLLPPESSSGDFTPESDGLEGFTTLLSELAHYLTEPLVVHAIGTVTGQFPLSACEWRAEPDGTVSRALFSCSSEVRADTALPSIY